MISIILGAGEIGQSYYDILTKNEKVGKVFRVDVDKKKTDKLPCENVHMMHVCLRWSDRWFSIVKAAIKKYRPEVVNVMSTVPPGTTASLGNVAVHSTTRGLHPYLSDFIKATPKHVGGPQAKKVADYFQEFGIQCITHSRAKTTEVAHILSNSLYAVQIAFADELEKACRMYGVDYYHSVMRYSETHNEGYAKMGLVSKFRPILTPPNARIGGHCVINALKMIDPDKRGPIMELLLSKELDKC